MRTAEQQARLAVLTRLADRIAYFRLLSAEAAEGNLPKSAEAYGQIADGLRHVYELERDDPEPR